MANKLSDIFEDKTIINIKEESFSLTKTLSKISKKNPTHSLPLGGDLAKINIIAMGDVGGTLAIGLKLLGGDVISQIGLFDINPSNTARYEFELNQINNCFQEEGVVARKMPIVKEVSKENLFDCDVVLFCASLGVPKVGDEASSNNNTNGDTSTTLDVRMVQLEKNKALVKTFANDAISQKFKGKFFVISDPVDPLCKAALDQGLLREQVRGFGLGVMNARAIYYSSKSADEKISIYQSQGRAFGPHGGGLVIANSIYDYNEQASNGLTNLTETANLKMRELGFKPYIAPALSSGAISIIDFLSGRWNYSSIYFGVEQNSLDSNIEQSLNDNGSSSSAAVHKNTGAFWGCRNRESLNTIEVENLPLDINLMEKIRLSYDNLSKV